MGEKGIGRLAIAVAAPITLLMTRAARPDGLSNLVVALVHWGLFEQPGLDISQIDVPIEEYPPGELPTQKDIGLLVDSVANNIANLESDIAPHALEQLNDCLNQVRLIGPDALDKNLNKEIELPLSLSNDGYGTHFIMLPTAPELDDDIDGGTDKESSKLERNLLGFSNLMSLNEPVIKTEFRDHKSTGIEEQIGSKSFFGSDDFNITDQLFEGNFDDNGQFVGTVSIYGSPRKFVCNWAEGKGRKSKCGAFYFRYGYIQGDIKETRLNPEDWREIKEKTSRTGGLYIYRDGIRILPYGNSDVDWLDIEKRRTLKASDCFFSYRRGFGYISISHEENEGLTEKAGREGFRENQAYRDFRSILINFFKQLAYEFFRESSPQGEDYLDNKKALKEQAETLKIQKGKAEQRRQDIKGKLEHFFNLYNSGFFEENSTFIEEEIKRKIEALESELDFGETSLSIRELEIEANLKIRKLTNSLSIVFPRGLSLGKKLQKDWNSFESLSAKLKETVILPLAYNVDQLFLRAKQGRISNAIQREQAIQDIEAEKSQVIKEISSLRRDTSDALENMQNTVKEVMKDEFSELSASIEILVSDFIKESADRPEKVIQSKRYFEEKIVDAKNKERELLDSLRRQMVDLSEDIKARQTLDDRFAALEARNLVLEEQLEFYSDFAQMGMSVSILQHEFEGAAKGIRKAMAALKPWANRNPPIGAIYQGLRSHIEHLDGYLKVLDPLGRRMHRSTIDISGDEILNVIRNVFSDPLEASSIELEPTLTFRSLMVSCKSSVVIGAFINVIDNAIYWLNSRAQGHKKITLDADDSSFIVSNSGPGIEDRFRERIFDFGETKKPGGRGMGLAVSREVLRREGFEMELVQSGIDVEPVFKIYSKESQE